MWKKSTALFLDECQHAKVFVFSLIDHDFHISGSKLRSDVMRLVWLPLASKLDNSLLMETVWEEFIFLTALFEIWNVFLLIVLGTHSG